MATTMDRFADALLSVMGTAQENGITFADLVLCLDSTESIAFHEEWERLTEEAEKTDNWEAVQAIELEMQRRGIHPEPDQD